MNFFFSVQYYRDIKQIRNNDPTLARHPRLVGGKNAPSEKYAPMTLSTVADQGHGLISETICHFCSWGPHCDRGHDYIVLINVIIIPIYIIFIPARDTIESRAIFSTSSPYQYLVIQSCQWYMEIWPPYPLPVCWTDYYTLEASVLSTTELLRAYHLYLRLGIHVPCISLGLLPSRTKARHFPQVAISIRAIISRHSSSASISLLLFFPSIVRCPSATVVVLTLVYWVIVRTVKSASSLRGNRPQRRPIYG